jgi:hypothetical protein
MAVGRRQTKSGKVHQHSLNTQDHPRLNLDAHGKALHMFEEWAALRPKYGYYDCLPPAAQMAVDAVGEVVATLKR